MAGGPVRSLADTKRLLDEALTHDPSTVPHADLRAVLGV